MRTTSILSLALGLAACTGSVEPCSSRPSDPVCQGLLDSGTDTGVDAGPDAHVPCGGACTGATPHCNPTTNTCVECVTSGDCSGMECDTMGTHTCVECVSTASCTDPTAPRCDATAHTCGDCTSSADCTHLTATPHCDSASGACVECTAADASACASGICLTSTGTCAPMGGTTGPCGACTSDSDCRAGQLCVPLTYDDPTTAAADPVPVGNHCMWRQDAAGAGAPNGDCLANERPYVRASMLTSVDGTSAMMCVLAVSTCEAQAAFRMTDCMTLDAAGDARCGLTDVHDGVCRMASATLNRCTTFCLSDDDCRSGSSCDTAAVPPVCHF